MGGVQSLLKYLPGMAIGPGEKKFADLEDAIDIREIKNIKMANQLLKVKRKAKQEQTNRLLHHEMHKTPCETRQINYCTIKCSTDQNITRKKYCCADSLSTNSLG